MSAVTMIGRQVERRPALGAPAATLSLAGLALAWEVLPDAPGVKSLAPGEGEVTAARLVFEFESGGARAIVEVVRAGIVERISVSHGVLPVRVSERDGVVHAEVTGVLRATLTVSEGGARAVYARTPLLESLGFPGGCYDRPSVSGAGGVDRA